MQNTLTGIMAALMVVIAILYIKMGKVHRNEMTKRLRVTALVCELIFISEAAIINLKDRRDTYLVFTMYYILVAWFVFFVYRFCISYAGYAKKKFYKSVFFWVTIAESIWFISEFYDEGLFTIMHTKWFERDVWVARSLERFDVHIAISCVVLFFSMSALILATVKSANIYKPRYFGVLVTLIVAVVIYMVSQAREMPLFISVFSTALCEIFVIYLAVYYAPKKLKQRALMFAAKQFNDGLVLYDEEKKLQFVTEEFCNSLGIGDIQVLYDEESFWGDYLKDAVSGDMWNGMVKAIERDGRKIYYETETKSFVDNGIEIGTVYWITDVTDSVENYEKVAHRANYDELTGLYNEVHFHEECRKLLDEWPEKEFIMICSHAEKFKLFRDIFGRERAKDYLVETAKYLKKHLVKILHCVYGRIDESSFCIMMDKEEYKESDLLEAVDAVAEKFHTNNYTMSINLGICEITDRSLRMTAICNRASMACDAAKGDYHRRVVWFDENVQKKSMMQEKYNAELTKAIEEGQIRIFLQPQMDKDGNILGAEALARWIHPEDGLVSPANFIPYFEKNGRITELDMCIWRQACKKLGEWKKAGRTDIYISVNISAKDLYALSIYDEFTNLVKEYDISPKNLKLEITESSVVNDITRHINLINELQEAGFEVEMDDFGSAYSSFNMLKDVCVDVLKIDMKFLGETKNIERSRTILKSIVTLSRELCMKTVAEGVETKEQLDFLTSSGCDIYQGYYFAKPMSVDDFEEAYL